jgi:hypothetical protein
MEFKSKRELGKAVRMKGMLNDTKIVNSDVIRQS